MSAKLSIQHNDDSGACCVDPWGQKHKKQQSGEVVMSDVDLAKEMNELSFEQRERILEDVHGVAEVVDETPELIEDSIAELDKELAKIPRRKRKAYNKAVFFRPTLQNDRKSKLQFLRAEEFNTEKAAERLVKHYQQKSDLFGEEKLGTTLTLDDLTEDDLYLYKIGYMMLLPSPDRSGRPIIFCDGTKLDFERMTIDNIIRCYWYLMAVCYDDEVAQKKGSCTTLRFSGARRKISKSAELAKRTAYNSECVPGRNSSFHICYDDPKMNFIINLLRFKANQFTRVRMRAHLGSEVENDYKLMTFGISCDGLLQRILSGDLFFADNYIQNCRTRDKRIIEEEEEEEARTGTILYPRPKDILIGRGQSYRGLPGNAMWEEAMQRVFEDFKSRSTQFEKTCIAMEVVKSVQEKGARFLKREEDGWKILDDVTARLKTAIAFRNHGKTFSSTTSTSTGPPAKTTATQVSQPYLDVVTNIFPVPIAAKRQRL